MNLELILAITALSLYVLASIKGLLSLLTQTSAHEKFITILTSTAALLLSLTLIQRGIHNGHLPAFGLFESITWYAIAITASYLHIATHHKTQGISGIIFPFVTAILFIAVANISKHIISPPRMPTCLLDIHIVTAFFGYGMFTIASTLALAYLIQDYNLKYKHFETTFDRLPSLETLNHIMCTQTRFAFLLLTISIAAAVAMTHITGSQKKWLTDPKAMATIVTWMIYALLLHMRAYGKRQGRNIAIATLAGLFFVLFTFFGVKTLGNSIHDFVTPTITTKTNNSTKPLQPISIDHKEGNQE